MPYQKEGFSASKSQEPPPRPLFDCAWLFDNAPALPSNLLEKTGLATALVVSFSLSRANLLDFEDRQVSHAAELGTRHKAWR